MKLSMQTRLARSVATAAIATALVVPATAGVSAAAHSKAEPTPQRSTTYARVSDDDTAYIPSQVLGMLYAFCVQHPFPMSVPVCSSDGPFG